LPALCEDKELRCQPPWVPDMVLAYTTACWSVLAKAEETVMGGRVPGHEYFCPWHGWQEDHHPDVCPEEGNDGKFYYPAHMATQIGHAKRRQYFAAFYERSRAQAGQKRGHTSGRDQGLRPQRGGRHAGHMGLGVVS